MVLKAINLFLINSFFFESSISQEEEECSCSMLGT